MSASNANYLACSVAGLAHKRVEAGCDDASLVDCLGPARMLVLADGRSGAKYAAIGAQLAVTWAALNLRRRLSSAELDDAETVLPRAVLSVHKRLRREARRLRCKLRDLDCTLTIAFITASGAVSTRIGDGAVIVEDSDGELHCLSREPKSGGPVNLSHFVTEPDEAENPTTTRIDGEIVGFGGCTDGLENLSVNREGSPHAPFWRPFFKLARTAGMEELRHQVSKFLHSDRVNAASGDDLTIAIGILAEQSDDFKTFRTPGAREHWRQVRDRRKVAAVWVRWGSRLLAYAKRLGGLQDFPKPTARPGRPVEVDGASPSKTS